MMKIMYNDLHQLTTQEIVMIRFEVIIPSKGPLTQEEEDRLIWAIFNTLSIDMKPLEKDIPQLNLDKTIVNRK